MIALRRQYPVLSSERFYAANEITWFQSEGVAPDWHLDAAIGCHLHPGESNYSLCLIANPMPETIAFHLPAPAVPGDWLLLVDTALPAPYDVVHLKDAKKLPMNAPRPVKGRSFQILVSTRHAAA